MGVGVRGYLSFLLVFASVLIVLSAIHIYLISGNIDASDAILAERTHQENMNLKELVLEAVREGGQDGYSFYDSLHSHESCVKYCPNMGACTLPHTPPCDLVQCELSCFRLSDAQKAAEDGAISRLQELAKTEFSEDFTLWCGEVSDSQSRKLAKRMREEKTTLSCENCMMVADESCTEYLNAEINVTPDIGETSGILSSITLSQLSGEGVIGISMYSGKFDAASVSHIPGMTKVVYR